MLEYSSSPSSLPSPLSPPFPGIISRPFSFAAPLICHAFVCGYFQLPLLLCSVDFHCQSDCFSSQFLSTLFLSAAQHPHIDTQTHTHTESNCWLGVFFNLSTCWLPTLTKSASLATGRAVRPAGQTQSRKISRVCRQPTAKGLNALVYIATVTSAPLQSCLCLLLPQRKHCTPKDTSSQLWLQLSALQPGIRFHCATFCLACTALCPPHSLFLAAVAVSLAPRLLTLHLVVAAAGRLKCWSRVPFFLLVITFAVAV